MEKNLVRSIIDFFSSFSFVIHTEQRFTDAKQTKRSANCKNSPLKCWNRYRRTLDELVELPSQGNRTAKNFLCRWVEQSRLKGFHSCFTAITSNIFVSFFPFNHTKLRRITTDWRFHETVDLLTAFLTTKEEFSIQKTRKKGTKTFFSFHRVSSEAFKFPSGAVVSASNTESELKSMFGKRSPSEVEKFSFCVCVCAKGKFLCFSLRSRVFLSSAACVDMAIRSVFFFLSLISMPGTYSTMRTVASFTPERGGRGGREREKQNSTFSRLERMT